MRDQNEVIEKWAPVLHYEELYEVCDKGRVRRTGEGHATYPGREMKATPVRGYMRLNLFRGGKCIQYSVHRIVYEAFNGPIPQGMHINHIDGNPENNRLENLECVTPRENVLHALNSGAKKSVKRSLGKKNAELVRKYRSEKGCSVRWLAAIFGVQEDTISRALNFRTYTNA